MKSTKELPLFDSKAACPKCGIANLVVRFRQPKKINIGEPEIFDWDNEHMEVNCPMCLYAWDARPRDQDMGAKPSDLLENLASLAHEIWANWMRYQFDKCLTDYAWPGDKILPKPSVERWTRQMNTPYSMLSAEEKKSDQEIAQKYLDVFRKAGKMP